MPTELTISRRCFLGSCIVVAAAGCGKAAGPPRPLVRSREVLDAVRESTSVEVLRVSSEPGDPTDRSAVGGFAIMERGNPLGPEFAARLSQTLALPTARPALARSDIEPGVAFRCRTAKGTAEVLIDFKHERIRAGFTDADGRRRFQETEEFDEARRDLVRLTREAFPSDPIVIGLSEEPVR